jgi:MFS family permease
MSFNKQLLAIAALFCALGFQYSTWTSRLPTFVMRLDLNPAEVGVLLLSTGLGAVAVFPIIPRLLRQLGSRRLALGAAVALAALLLPMAAAPSYPVLITIMLIGGVAVACLNVAMNAQGAALEVRHGRTAMARLHALFSGGALLAALLASGATALDPGLWTHFAIAIVVLLALIGRASSGLVDEDARQDPVRSGLANRAEPQRWRTITRPSPVVLWLAAAMVFSTVAEGAMNDWSALFLATVALASPAVVPMGIAVFSTTMVLARLFADGWRSNWGDGRVVVVGAAAACVGLATGLLAGGVVPALLGFACVGLGAAAVSPCVYATAARQGPGALTVVAAADTTGLLVGPPMIGFVAQVSNLRWGMGTVALCAAAVALCATRIRWTAPPAAATAD